ncbi:MAG: NAD(P)H-hydrate dehydratase [Ignavibacteriae bacterium]|nr:NAD(P)H-hydrate dehydratase [Ignavibacteriota bacterium]MCB9207315.1 NAD(P)H-hydrate dehydratase [Ignavibacteriales bacterium]
MIPLFSSDQVRSADSFAINELKIPSIVLMENAAKSIFHAILEKYPYLDQSYRFGIVCGKGNNGGDGFALARHLIISGFSVKVLSLADERDLKGDALTNFIVLKNFVNHYSELDVIFYQSQNNLNKIADCEVIVDAILGTGTTGTLKEPYNHIVEKLNDLPALKISIDVPTGLNLDKASGDIIFNSNLTVTLAGLKTGLFYEKGKLFSGKVVKGSIGMGECYFGSLKTDDYLIEPEDALIHLPQKKADLHKYNAGKVFVIAGSTNMPGAAVFTMNSTMISGTGAGKLFFPESIKSIAQNQMNSATVSGYADENLGFLRLKNVELIEKNIEWADAIAIGPGLGRESETVDSILTILKKFKKKKFIIDADAIFALSDKNYKNIDLSNCVLTPHHQEFANLISVDIKELKNNLLQLGRDFTKETNSFLVLKGAPTVIFNPEGEAFINSAGNSGLAKFGSGDVLTGIISSFVAQQEDIEKSLISAVYLHSLTADLIQKNESEFGITPQKLIDEFPKTIQFLRKSIV